MLRRDLGRIGIQLRVKSVDSPFGEAAKPHSSVDLMLGAWFADYPDPADFLNELFDPRPSGYGYALPYHHYGDTRWINRMRRAATVVGPGRATVYRELVGRMMRQSPPTAVFAIPRQPVQLFSENVGCQVFRPQDYGYVDLAALCLRGSP